MVKELFAGCICCQLTADLVTCVNNVVEKVNPVRIVIESTGLAYPEKIREILVKYGKGIGSIATVTVVDAERWDELCTVTPALVETQVVGADAILLNKTYLSIAKKVHAVENHLLSLNRKARVYKVSAAGIIDDAMWAGMDQGRG